MKKRTCLSTLLCLALALSILAGLPLGGEAATQEIIIEYPPEEYPPETVVPIWKPITIVVPDSGEDMHPVEPSPPEPAPAEPPYSESRLKLTVDKTEALVGDTLTFTASMSGGKGKRSVTLWIYKDGERAAILHSNSQNRWTYTPQEPGIYKGQAIGKDEVRTIYADSKKIDVVADGGMRWMDLDPPLIWIDPFGPVLTYVEGTSFEPIPVTVGGSEEIKDARLYINTTGLLQYSPVKEQFSPLTRQGEVWGYVRSDDFPNYPAVGEGLEWNEKDQLISQGDDPDETGFFGDELGLDIPAGINVIGTLKGTKVEAAYTFKIRYLRDSDRDGIPDVSETERDKIQITDIPDRSVYQGVPFRRFSYRVIDNGNAEWPVRYRSPGVQPYGIQVLPREWTDPGDPYSHGWGVFTGEPRINWLPGEMYRDLLIPYRAQDSKRDSVTHFFRMRVGKTGSQWTGFAKLSIDPIPSCTVVYGQKMKSIPITVRMSSPGIPTVEGYYIWLERKGDDLVFESRNLNDHNIKLSRASEAGVDQQNLHLTRIYWLNGTPRLKDPVKWRKGEKQREVEFTIKATLGSDTAYQRFTVTVLRPDRETGDEIEPLQFEPLNDVIVDEGVACKDIVCRLRSRQPLSGVTFSSSALPPGMGIGRDDGSSTAMLLRGRPYLEDWQPWESQRKILIYVFAKQKEKGLSSEESFYLTIRRKDRPKPGITPIATLEVVNDIDLLPVHVSCDLPPFMLNSLEAQGLPPGLKLGRGHVISGWGNVRDWKDDEAVRVYPVTIRGKAALPKRPELENEGTGNPTQYDVETAFNVKVFRKAPKGWRVEDPLPVVKVAYPMSQTVLLGQAIKPISILMDEKPPLTDVIVEGLPQGVSDDGSGNISGKPVVGNWSEDINEEKRFQVKATVSHPDLENDIVVKFDITVLHPHSAKAASLTGGTGTGALPADPDQQADSGANIGSEKPADQGTEPAEQPAEKPEASAGVEVEKPEDSAAPGASEAEESRRRDENVLSQNIVRQLSPGTPEYEELETWIAQQEEELGKLGPTAVREGKVRVAIAMYEGSQDEMDYAMGILLGLQKSGYVLDRRHLTTEIRSAQGDEEKAQRLIKRIGKGKYDLVIAIGAPMARMLTEALQGRVPLVCGMVEDPVSEGLSGTEGGIVTGVRLKPALEGLLSGALLLVPEATRVALIHTPDDRRQQDIQELAGRLGVAINAAAAADPAQLIEQAGMLLSDCDIMILTEDFDDEAALQQIAAMALEAGKPVCGASKAQVAAGLPAACVTDHRKGGAASGRLSALVLSGGDPATIPWQSLQEMDILYDPEGMTGLGITPPYAAVPFVRDPVQ